MPSPFHVTVGFHDAGSLEEAHMGRMSNDREDGSSQSFWERDGDSILGAAAVSVLGLGTVVYHLIEGWSWVDSFYFSAVAVTTVGFGDLTPSTDASKLFTVFYIFGGMTLIALWLNNRFKSRAAAVAAKKGGLEPVAAAITDAVRDPGPAPDDDVPAGDAG
jgi:hypothetical protein